MADAVNHPAHYGGGDNPYETIKVLEAWDWEMAYHFCKANSIKYLSRAGKKYESKTIEDLNKSAWYSSKAAEILERHKKPENPGGERPVPYWGKEMGKD